MQRSLNSKGRNLTGRFMRWYLTIQKFNLTFKYLPCRTSVMADPLFRNVPVGVVTHPQPVTESFSLDDLRVAQRNHDVWSRVTYALESGDETNLSALPVHIRQFFLYDERALCRYWPSKKQAVA